MMCMQKMKSTEPKNIRIFYKKGGRKKIFSVLVDMRDQVVNRKTLATSAGISAPNITRYEIAKELS